VENYFSANGANSSVRCFVKDILDCDHEFCYMVTPYGTPWTNACKGVRGELVSIRSLDENSYYQSLCSSYCWIGLSYAKSNGSWIWSDGSSINYTNWDANEPISTPGKEYYVQMNSDGTWAAKSEYSYNLRAICKYPNHELNSTYFVANTQFWKWGSKLNIMGFHILLLHACLALLALFLCCCLIGVCLCVRTGKKRRVLDVQTQMTVM